MMNAEREPKRAGGLIFLHFFLGIGAMFGGGALMIDPTGKLIGMPLSLLEHSLFASFLIPGVILFSVLGIGPIIVATGLIRRWNCILAQRVNIFRDRHWSWTLSLYTGFALLIWIIVEAYIINTFSIIHLIYSALGLVIQGVTLWPTVQEKYKV